MATTGRPISFGLENETPWGYLRGGTKRVLGSIVAVAGALLIISAIRGFPILD
jgi:hypothetical protein